MTTDERLVVKGSCAIELNDCLDCGSCFYKKRNGMTVRESSVHVAS